MYSTATEQLIDTAPAPASHIEFFTTDSAAVCNSQFAIRVQTTNPQETARLEMVVARIAIPATKPTMGTVKTRNIGSLLVTMTIAISVATAKHITRTVRMPPLMETEGESRATIKTM